MPLPDGSTAATLSYHLVSGICISASMQSNQVKAIITGANVWLDTHTGL
jgi:hypothetical protein